METEVDTTKKVNSDIELDNEEEIRIKETNKIRQLKDDDQGVIQEEALDQPIETENYHSRENKQNFEHESHENKKNTKIKFEPIDETKFPMEQQELKSKEKRERDKFLKIASQIQKELEDKNSRKEMKDRKGRTDNLLFFTFTILFIVVIFMQFDISQRYKVKTSLNAFFGFNKTNSKTFRSEDMQASFYNILSLADQLYWFLDKKYEIVSRIRTTIRRYKISPKNNTILKNTTFRVIGPPVKFGQTYDPNLEETSSYTNNNPFNLTFKYDRQGSYMQVGGYTFDYKKMDVLINNGDSFDPIKKQEIWTKFLYFSSLKDLSLTIIDFIVVNYELNYACLVVLRFEHSKSGFGTMYLDIRVLDSNTYGNIFSLVRAGLEGLVLLLLIYYSYFIIQSIRLKAKWQFEKILRNMIIEEKKILFSFYRRKVKRTRLMRGRRDAFPEILAKDDRESENNKDEPIKHNINREVLESVGILKNINVTGEKQNLKIGNDENNEIEHELEIEYDSYRDIEIPEKKIEKMKKKINMYHLYIRAISKNISSIVQVSNLFISFFCLVLWIIFAYNLLKNREVIIKLFDEWNYDFTTQTQNDLLSASDAIESYRNLLQINFLLFFFKLIGILSKYIKSINIFTNTIKYSITDLIAFFVFFTTLLIGFSFFTIFFYGRKIDKFNEFFYSVQQTLSFSLGMVDENVFRSMFDQSPHITLLYVQLIIIFLNIIIKILLAIILHYYKISYLEYANKLRDIEKSKPLSKKGVGRSPIMSILSTIANFPVYVYKLICCRLKQNKNLEEIKSSGVLRLKTDFFLRKQSTSILNKSSRNFMRRSTLRSFKIRRSIPQIKDKDKLTGIKEEYLVLKSKDKELYNLEYMSDYTFYLRNPYFDSVKDEWKLKDFYENKYKKIVLNGLFFLLFMVVFILLVFTVDFVPWHKELHNSLFNKLNDPNFNGFNKTDQFSEVTNIDKAKKFIFNNFPKIFEADKSESLVTYGKKNKNITAEKNHYLLRYNTLVRNSFIITLRYTEYDYGFEDQIRFYSNLDLHDMEYENTTSFNVGKFNFEYSTDSTFDNLGGFNLTLNLNEFPNGRWPSKEEQDKIFNNYLSYAIVEFICDNLEYNFFTYTKILFKNDYGSYNNLEYETKILKFYKNDTFFDYLSYALYIAFIVILSYQWIAFILNIYREHKFYDQWYKEVIQKLSIKTQELRNWKNPEILRKISFISDWEKIIELIVLILSTYCFYLLSHMALEKQYLASVYPDFYNSSSIEDIRNEIYLILYQKEKFEAIATIIIFLLSLRISIMINLGKYFSLLIRTIEESKYNNISFIVIVILVQPAFIFFSFLGFGESNYFYSTLPWAILSNFNVMFGNADFKSFSDSGLYGPLYFITYVLIINMLFMNIFQAVIDTSYAKVKEQIKNTNEKWSLKRVFLFCWFRKKPFMEAAKKSTADEDLLYDIQKQIFETKMNIDTSSAAKAYEELRKEVDQVKIVDDEVYSSKETLKKVENAWDSKRLGSVSYEENAFKDIEEKHVRCYRLNYIKKTVNIAEAIEQDILTIERYHEHLNEYVDHFKFDKLREEGKDKNEFMYEVSAHVGKNIVELTQDVNEIRKIFEEIEKIDEEIN